MVKTNRVQRVDFVTRKRRKHPYYVTKAKTLIFTVIMENYTNKCVCVRK